MEPSLKKERDADEREQLRRKVVDDSRSLLSYFWPIHPVQLFIDLLWASLRLFRPIAPHLVPLAVFSVTLPLIILMSIASGYLVWKNVAVGWELPLFLQYGDGGSPYAELALPNIVAQQPYDISLLLVVPASEANVALGNFMASLTMVTPSNNTIAVARKPAIVLPQYAVPWTYLYNRPGTVDLRIPMLSEFVAGTSRVLAKIELGRRDQWKSIGEGHGRELAVLSGTLRGIVLRRGFGGLTSRFPLIFAFLASCVFFFFMFVGLAACLMPIVEWHFPSDGEQRYALEPEDKPRKRRRSRRSERDSEEKERRSKSRTRTPTSRRTDASSSRSRQTREQEVKTEPEDDWDPPYQVATTPANAEGTVPIFSESGPPLRRRIRTPENDYFEQ